MNKTAYRNPKKTQLPSSRPSGPLLGSIAALLLCAAPAVFAASGTWKTTGSGSWNTNANWNPGPFPNATTDVATFGLANTPAISLSANTTVGGISFSTTASAYTITVGPNLTLTIDGVSAANGITNTSGKTQNFVANVNAAGANGSIVFNNTASAGVNTLFTNIGATKANSFGGAVQFNNNSTAGSATFVNQAGAVGGTFQTFDVTTGVFTSDGASGGAVLFRNNSTAGTGSFTNNAATVSGANGGSTVFFDNSTAGNGKFTNNGGTVGKASGGSVEFNNNSTAGSGTFTNNAGAGGPGNGAGTLFFDTSTAGSGTFVNNGGVGSTGVGGGTQFYDNSSAGTAKITSNGGSGSGTASASLAQGAIGGLTLFAGSSTASNATLIANGGTFAGSGGAIVFLGNSTGGTSTVKLFGNGGLDISAHNTSGVTIGSLEGDGKVFLGNNNLTVGSNNLSTTFDGVIQDGSMFNTASSLVKVSQIGGSLTKDGTGALTLTGIHTYTGNTTVSGGSLIINGSIQSPLTTVNTKGALLGYGTLGGDLTNNGIVAPGNIPLPSGNLQSLIASAGTNPISIKLNVTNFPATQLTMNVKGNFTQGSGGSLVILYGGAADTQHTSLKVQGKATLGGNLRLVQVNGAEVQAGDSVQIVSATGGVSGKFATVTDAPLIKANVVYQTNAVVLETSQGAVSAFIDDPALKGVAGALDSAAGDPRAAQLFATLNSLDANQLAQAVQLINPVELTATSAVGNSVSGVHNQNLQLRMAALRAGVTGFSAMGYHTADNPADYSSGLAGPSGPDGKSGKEIAPPPPDNRWGTFITGAGQFNHVGDTQNARGYNLDSGGITLGVDYRFTDHFVAGIFAGYTYTGIDIGDGGRIAADAGKVGLYSTYFNGGFYLDTAVQGGYSSYESNRTGLNGRAHGSPHGGDFNLLVAPGYNWTFGALTIGPTASFQYSYQGTNGFTETGSDAPMRLSSQHTTSLISTVGMKASYDWKLGSTIIRPEVRLSWQHEYGDVSSTLDSQLASGAGSSFRVTGPEIGRDSMIMGAGFSVVWSDRFSTYVYYDGEFFRNNYDSSTVTGGFRLLF